MRLLSSDDVQQFLALAVAVPSSICADLASDPNCGPPLRVYLALTEGRLGGDLTPEDRLYNRFFWFQQFAVAHCSRFGFDAGIEQQASQILEHADCEVDFTIVEQLEAAVQPPTNKPLHPTAATPDVMENQSGGG